MYKKKRKRALCVLEVGSRGFFYMLKEEEIGEADGIAIHQAKNMSLCSSSQVFLVLRLLVLTDCVCVCVCVNHLITFSLLTLPQPLNLILAEYVNGQ